MPARHGGPVITDTNVHTRRGSGCAGRGRPLLVTYTGI
ncbi:hypothetical protein AB395_00005285 (plasmid) [Sinorhizobium fredii CCBAU 45436]|nr:hypothetical protein AB395_00005285 [Sinorhizobium fredii CCBAU 45436]